MSRFVLNRKGVRELLKSPEMTKIISDSTAKVLQAAQEDCDGYQSEVKAGRARTTGTVWTGDLDAYHSSVENNTLLKALKRGKV